MRSLLFVLLAVFFEGCFFGLPTTPDAGIDEENKPVTPVFHTLTVNWSLKKPNGMPEVCPTNYGFIRIAASAFSTIDTSNGDDFWAVFPCSAGRGTIRLQTAGDEVVPQNADGSYPRQANRNITGRYRITLAISEMSGETEFHAALRAQEVDLSGGDKSVSFDVYPTAGMFQPEWAFRGAMSGSDLSCAAANVTSVRIKYQRVATEDGTLFPMPEETTQTAPCDSTPATNQLISCTRCPGAVTSVPLLFGQYLVAVEALSGTNVVGKLDYETVSIGNTVLVDRNGVKLIKGGGPTRVNAWVSKTYAVEITNR